MDPYVPPYSRRNTAQHGYSTQDTNVAVQAEGNVPELEPPAYTGMPDDEDNRHNLSIIPVKYLNLEFDSCFYEHESTSTVPIIYKLIGYVFKYTKFFFYNFLVIVFGVLIAFIWAMLLGIFSFVLTWIWTPVLKAFILGVSAVLPAVTEPLKALLIPLVDAQARIFRQIRLRGWFDGGLMNPLAQRSERSV